MPAKKVAGLPDYMEKREATQVVYQPHSKAKLKQELKATNVPVQKPNSQYLRQKKTIDNNRGTFQYLHNASHKCKHSSEFITSMDLQHNNSQ